MIRTAMPNSQQQRHYIFGYGSLINSASRRITGIAGDSVAVKVAGLQRKWVASAGYNMRSVGVVEHSNSRCNGVLFEVPESELNAFDIREANYQRCLLDPEQIDLLSHSSAKLNIEQPIWVYLFPHFQDPANTCPISQSYLDVIILGCLEIGEGFAREFLQHTWDWQHWFDDRRAPVYPRATRHSEHEYIDALLRQERQEFSLRY